MNLFKRFMDTPNKGLEEYPAIPRTKHKPLRIPGLDPARVAGVGITAKEVLARSSEKDEDRVSVSSRRDDSDSSSSSSSD